MSLRRPAVACVVCFALALGVALYHIRDPVPRIWMTQAPQATQADAVQTSVIVPEPIAVTTNAPSKLKSIGPTGGKEILRAGADVPSIVKISPEGGSYMYGYFDKKTVDDANRRVIVCKIPFFDREPLPDSEMVVGFVDIDGSQEFHPVGTTTAWNLQQGTMAEWVGPDSIIYNVRLARPQNPSRQFASRIVNVNTSESSDVPRPVYAFNRATMTIASLPFDRLHNLRRGYGYTVPLVPPEKVPENDGIWLVDLGTLKERLILSFGHVRTYILSTNGRIDDYTAQKYTSAPTGANFYWWINHCMFSSDGSQLAFLVRAHTQAGTPEYSFSTLMMYEMASSSLWRVPQVAGSHHFFGTFLLSCDNAGTFEIHFRKRVNRLPWQKGVDGHCSLSPDEKWILTDTYPDRNGYKKLFLEETRGTKKHDLGSFKALERGPIQTRCDLHPRWDREGAFIIFDSTHGATRAVYRAKVPSGDTGMQNIQAPATRSPRQEAAIATKHLYIDLGARDGDTVEEYVKKHEKEFRSGTLQILAVEANPENIPFFRARMQKLGRDFPLVDSHVTLFHQAAWNSSTTLTFHLDTGKRPWRKGARAEQELSGGSVFRSPYATKGDAHVEAFDTADWISKHCVKDGRKYPFVFLKMDIEGAEYPVIRNLLNRPEVLGLVDEWLVEFHDGKTNPWKPLVASDTLQQDFKSAVVAKGAKYHDRH